MPRLCGTKTKHSPLAMSQRKQRPREAQFLRCAMSLRIFVRISVVFSSDDVIRVFLTFIHPWLSMHSIMGLLNCSLAPISFNNWFAHNISFAPSPAARYSASVVDWATTSCFFDFQVAELVDEAVSLVCMAQLSSILDIRTVDDGHTFHISAAIMIAFPQKFWGVPSNVEFICSAILFCCGLYGMAVM